MARDRHSKYKNTGILFELLVRQITNDMMLGNENSPAVSLVKEFFRIESWNYIKLFKRQSSIQQQRQKDLLTQWY